MQIPRNFAKTIASNLFAKFDGRTHEKVLHILYGKNVPKAQKVQLWKQFNETNGKIKTIDKPGVEVQTHVKQDMENKKAHVQRRKAQEEARKVDNEAFERAQNNKPAVKRNAMRYHTFELPANVKFSISDAFDYLAPLFSQVAKDGIAEIGKIELDLRVHWRAAARRPRGGDRRRR